VSETNNLAVNIIRGPRMSKHDNSKEQKIRVLFCDQLNLARGKYLPRSFASKGEAMLCKGVYSVTYSKQIVEAPHGGYDQGLPDVCMKFDPQDYRTSWEPNSVIALADVYEHERPFGLCGRAALKKAIKAWQKHGLNPMIGLEGEAYVVSKENSKLVPYDAPGACVYGTGIFNDPEGLMDLIWDEAAKCNIPIESLNAEFDSPQFELTLRYSDALSACDNFFLFKNLAREVLYKKGYLLSFLAKPFAEISGSGLHINISFTDKNGNNALADGVTKNNLSDLTKGCIAGLLQHHEALSAVIAPTVNSYARLKPANMCGYWANWGHDHRAVAVRISSEAGTGARIEHRVGDGSASPYFAVAAVLQAALLGYENSYELPPEELNDGFEKVSTTRHVGDSLGESILMLEADKKLASALGIELIENYCAVKRAEIAELDGKSTDQIVAYYSHYI
jgi:glutamine synthetase